MLLYMASASFSTLAYSISDYFSVTYLTLSFTCSSVLPNSFWSLSRFFSGHGFFSLSAPFLLVAYSSSSFWEYSLSLSWMASISFLLDFAGDYSPMLESPSNELELQFESRSEIPSSNSSSSIGRILNSLGNFCIELLGLNLLPYSGGSGSSGSSTNLLLHKLIAPTFTLWAFFKRS